MPTPIDNSASSRAALSRRGSVASEGASATATTATGGATPRDPSQPQVHAGIASAHLPDATAASATDATQDTPRSPMSPAMFDLRSMGAQGFSFDLPDLSLPPPHPEEKRKPMESGWLTTSGAEPAKPSFRQRLGSAMSISSLKSRKNPSAGSGSGSSVSSEPDTSAGGTGSASARLVQATSPMKRSESTPRFGNAGTAASFGVNPQSPRLAAVVPPETPRYTSLDTTTTRAALAHPVARQVIQAHFDAQLRGDVLRLNDACEQFKAVCAPGSHATNAHRFVVASQLVEQVNANSQYEQEVRGLLDAWRTFKPTGEVPAQSALAAEADRIGTVCVREISQMTASNIVLSQQVLQALNTPVQDSGRKPGLFASAFRSARQQT